MFDLVMWTKNGAKTLNVVLTQIEKAVPEKVVNQKIIVDDSSVDATRQIAARHGWKVYRNLKTGVANGANQALSYVSTEYFCSFEQDILLSPSWFSRMQQRIQSFPNAGCVQGVRVPTSRVLRFF